MKKVLLILAVLAVSRPGILRAQTVDDVIDKHLAASGGRAALSRNTSRITTGTITLTTPAGDVDGSVEMYAKAPNKSRTVIKIDLTSFNLGQMVQDQRFDGTSGYAIDTLQGNRDITGDQLDIMRAGRFPSPLMDYKSAGFKAELLGKEKLGTGEAYVIRLTPPAGPSPRVFIDAASYLIVKTVVTINVPQLGTDVEQNVELSDYRDADGVQVPFRIRSVNSLQAITMTFSKVEQNTDIDDKSFSKP